MKLKKMFACVIAVLVVASMLTFSAFAATQSVSITQGFSDELYYFTDDEAWGGVIYYIDLYSDMFGVSIFDDITELDGAVAIGVKFKVSNYDALGTPFDAGIDVFPEESDFFADPYMSKNPTKVDGDGEYEVWTELDEPLVTGDLWIAFAGRNIDDDDDTASPLIEILEVMIRTETEDEDGNTEGGNTEGGNTEGGNTEGGNTEGGNTEGGNTEGGNTEGGNTEGGNTEGGNTEGGNTEGGNTEGGTTNPGTGDTAPLVLLSTIVAMSALAACVASKKVRQKAK